MRRSVLILGLVLASPAWAAEVVSVTMNGGRFTITPAAGIPWTTGDAVCILHGPVKVACGWVIKQVPEGAVVEVLAPVEGTVRLGDLVDRAEGTAQVYRVVTDRKAALITHAGKERWKPGDTICLYRKSEPLGCGEIAKSDSLAARVDLFWSSGTSFASGDTVKEAPGKARVLRVEDSSSSLVIGQALVKPWKIGDTLGVISAGEPVAWGEVVKAFPLSAEVRILSAKGSFDEGDWVKPMPLPLHVKGDSDDGSERHTAAVAETFTFRNGSRDIFTMGLLSLVPSVNYARALYPRVTLGGALLLPSQALGGGRVSGVGVLGTVTYFPKIFPKGLWLQMAAGAGPLTLSRAGVDDSVFMPLFSSTAGWRWSWASGLTASAGLGALFLPQTSTARVFLNHSGILPSLQLDLGWVF